MKRLTVWTIAVMTIIIACFSTVAALTNVEFFENDTSIESINFTWLNPPGEVFNHTTIWIPPYSCAWDSYINITGSNMSGANDSAYEVVLVTDLSWSMDDCLAEVEIRENLTYEEKFEQCDAFTDRFQEGEHSWKWNFYRGNWGLTFMNDEHISASTALGQSNHTYAQETAAIAEVRDLTFRNFTMEFMTLIYSGTGLLSERYVQVGFAKPMPTPANAYPLTGYTLRLTGDDHMQLFDGHDMVADEDMTGSIDTADYYQYKIIATDERILVYANDTWVIDVNTSPIINYTLSSDLVDGYISLATSQVYGIFDNIYIKSLEHRYNCTDHYGYASHLPTFNPSFRYSNITTIAAETPQCILPKIKNYTASSCDGLLGCEGPFCDEFENVTDITCGSRLQCSGPVCNVTTAQWTKNFSTTACTDLPPSLQIPSLCNATLDCNAALVRNQSAADCTGKWLCQGPVCDVPRAAWDKNYTANSCADIVVVNNGTFCDDRRYCDNTAFQNFTIPPGCLDMNNSILPACQPNNIGALPQHAGLMNISTQYWCDGTRELFNSTATSCAGLFDCAARCDNYIMNFTLDNCAGQPMCNMTAGCNGSISDIMNYTATDCSWFQTTITPDITYICNINVNYTSIIQNFTLPPVCPPDAVFCDTNYACNTSLFQDYGATDCSMYPGFPAFVNPSMCNGPICGTYTQNFTMNADCSQQYAPFCNDTLVCNVGLVNNYTTLDCSRYSPAPLTNVCDPSLTCGSYFKNFTTDLNCGVPSNATPHGDAKHQPPISMTQVVQA